MGFKYDFSGWATKNDLLCADGRTIRHNAFKDDDGKIVPLMWNHDHSDPDNVLGHALLVNKPDGVRMYGSFNDSKRGRQAKTLVSHGDIKAVSIWANKLSQRGGDVLHGVIREVSLVVAGANPAAYIDNVMVHSDEAEDADEAIIYTGEAISHSAGEIKLDADEEVIEHADEKSETEETKETKETNDSDDKKTIREIINGLSEVEKKAVYALIGMAVEEASGGKKDEKIEHSDNEEEELMHKNVFEQTDELKHDGLSREDVAAIFADAKKSNSLKDVCLAHGIEEIKYLAHGDADYGVENIGYLFPEARTLNTTPDFIQRDQTWVGIFMNGVHRSPFSRIKSIHANITEDEARAKGYIKGNMKKEEVFPLLKRTTTPTTVYKKQKFDRDDIVDITDFDAVGWIKGEMRVMLNEEIARAGLIGDGRSAADDDKISELNIRPIWTDEDLYSVKVPISVETNDTSDDKAKNFIRAVIKNRRKYKGSGNPTLFCTEELLDDMLLITDTTGRDIYDDIDKLKRKLRVKDIITVPVMDDCTRSVSGTTHTLAGILVNLNDYNIGADKGGAINMFDDFDIDFNQLKYLMETRCSGALTKPYSALVMEFVPAS
uniref:Major capsid protein n=1 Tax=Siphoviridae sp. ctuyW65 TaxID=2826508 RepID=A0A8S5QW25_9CAUD|nr:MAG TPA: major capsid protein [Siphoviridae sp. ctuyW65]